jgi:putative membrane protein
MTWVMCVFVHHLSLHLLLKSLLVGLLMTSWDFFLDPQMTSVKYWVWQTTEPDLPGIPGIPLINYVGWLISGTLMAIIVLVLLGQSVVQRTLARVILAWTIAGGFVLHAVFWGDLAVGIWGLSAMTLLWYVVEKRIRHRA